VWGTGDFAGGLASRRASVGLTLLVSQGLGLLLGLVMLGQVGEGLPPLAALLWAALAGLSGIGGVACFYRGLSGGTMALVAPLAGVIGAVLPAGVALVAGEQVSTVRLVGLVLAIGAIALISVPQRRGGRLGHLRAVDLGLAVLAGLGFAGFFLFLDRSTAVGGVRWWPLVTIRLTGLLAVLLAVAALTLTGRGVGPRQRLATILGRHRLRATSAELGWLAVGLPFLLAGVGDLGGNVFFMLANDSGTLAVAVVLSSLYPVVTALLAALLLHERLGRAHASGVGLAALAAALVGVG
jgi:drug/metabolite transporter (DMT)-like permease